MDYNKKIGNFGENIAREYLIRHNYKIIGANVKISYWEIDIIARKGEEIVFIEVKTRTSANFGQADEAITDRKINNYSQAALNYLNENKIDEKSLRFDLISLDLDRGNKIAKIKHYKGIM